MQGKRDRAKARTIVLEGKLGLSFGVVTKLTAATGADPIFEIENVAARLAGKQLHVGIPKCGPGAAVLLIPM